MIDKPNVDWSKVCVDIRSHYKNLSAVGKEVGSDWAHLNRLARGDVMQPKYSVGVKLLDLHKMHCPDLHNKCIKL